MILSSFSQFPQEKGLQEFNVAIITEISSMNYDLRNEAVITDWRITVSLGVNLHVVLGMMLKDSLYKLLIAPHDLP